MINQHFTSQDIVNLIHKAFGEKVIILSLLTTCFTGTKYCFFVDLCYSNTYLRADSIAFLPLKPSCWSTSDIACISMLRAFYAFFLWLQWYFWCQLPCTKNIRNQLRGAKLALLCWQLERVRVSRKSKISW